jgi:hypothetical protein
MDGAAIFRRIVGETPIMYGLPVTQHVASVQPYLRSAGDSGAIGNRCVRLFGRTTTGLWIRFEWPIRAETVPRFCWWPTIAVQAND